MYADEERPPSLLQKRPLEPLVMLLGVMMALSAHLLIPAFLLASQWLLVLLGLAIPVEEREREKPPLDVIAAEFVKLGKPFDPTKLPQRKVPPVIKRRPDAVSVSRDAKEQPKVDDKKERPKETQDSLLDNLVDRTKDFAEDVQTEEEGDPDGIAEGTANQAKLGNIYLGKLSIFFRRNWQVSNIGIGDVEKLTAIAAVRISGDGHVETVEIQTPSGDPSFDQSVIDAITTLIRENAPIPEPPPEIASTYYGNTLPVRFRGSDAR